MGPCQLHFRGLGHPSVAFWPLWVPRLMSGSHAVSLFGDFDSLWASKWSARAAEGTQKSCRRVPLGHLFPTFLDENVTARKACVNLAPFLCCPTNLWTAQPSIRCSLRSPNDVFPFRHLRQKRTRKVSIWEPFGTPFS